MLVLREIIEYEAPVTVDWPDGRQETFTVRFGVHADLRERLRDPEQMDAALRETIVGWSDVVDAENKQIPFSVTARDQLLDNPWIARGLVDALVTSFAAKRGNS